MNYELIWSEFQLAKFHELLGPLRDDEAYFISMSVRKKYLPPVMRERYALRNAEMFARKLIKDSTFDTYKRTIRMLEVNDNGGYTDKHDKPLPVEAMVVYAQINPVSGTQALQEFQHKVTDLMLGLPSNPSSRGQLARLDTLLMNCYQRSHGTKHLLDIDIDNKDFHYVERLLDEFKVRDIRYHVISTRSGYHIMLERETVKFNYHELVHTVNHEMYERGDEGEVVVNKNYMVPTPGTYQAGHKVALLDV